MRRTAGRPGGDFSLAESAVIVGGFAFLALGILLVIVVVARRDTGAQYVALAPPQDAPSTPTPAPPIYSVPAQSPYSVPAPSPLAQPPAPAPQAVTTAPAVAPAPVDDEEEIDADEESDRSPGEINLGSPWGPPPRNRNGDEQVEHGVENPSARLAREARERAREVEREERRRQAAEKARREAEQNSSSTASNSPPPASSPPPGSSPGSRYGQGPSQWSYHNRAQEIAMRSMQQAPLEIPQQQIATQTSYERPSRVRFRSLFGAVSLTLIGLQLLFSSLLGSGQDFREGKLLGPISKFIGVAGARVVALVGGLLALPAGLVCVFLCLKAFGIF